MSKLIKAEIAAEMISQETRFTKSELLGLFEKVPEYTGRHSYWVRKESTSIDDNETKEPMYECQMCSFRLTPAFAMDYTESAGWLFEAFPAYYCPQCGAKMDGET